MSEPTRGPWIVDEGYMGVPQIGSASGSRIAEIDVDLLEGDPEANARLVASAPELLSTLEALIKDIDDWNEAVQQVIGRFPNYEWNELEGARRVVAKAKGEQ